MFLDAHCFLVGAAEVVFRLFNTWFDGFAAWFPSSWAHFTMNIGVLECLYQTKCFIDATSNGQIVDSDLTQFLLTIDDIQTTEWNAGFLIEYTVCTWNVHRLVGQQWDVQFAQTALLAWCVDPCQMREVAISWNTNYFGIDFTEFFRAIWKCNDLGWANECAAEEKITIKSFIKFKFILFSLSKNDWQWEEGMKWISTNKSPFNRLA